MKFKTAVRITGIVLMCVSILVGVIKAILGRWATEALSIVGTFSLGFLFIYIPELIHQNQQKELRKKEKKQVGKAKGSTLKGACRRPCDIPVGKFSKDMLFCNKCNRYVRIYHETEFFSDKEDSAFDRTRNECKCKECHNVLKSDWSVGNKT